MNILLLPHCIVECMHLVIVHERAAVIMDSSTGVSYKSAKIVAEQNPLKNRLATRFAKLYKIELTPIVGLSNSGLMYHVGHEVYMFYLQLSGSILLICDTWKHSLGALLLLVKRDLS